jgi:hypothetical protein
MRQHGLAVERIRRIALVGTAGKKSNGQANQEDSIALLHRKTQSFIGRKEGDTKTQRRKDVGASIIVGVTKITLPNEVFVRSTKTLCLRAFAPSC